MSQLNLYYRAFREYRKHTLKDKACVKQRREFKQAASESDKLEMIRNVYVIDEEWIAQIEAGLPYIEKAIAEERQFIKNEGDVIPIEKVKHVSKASVEHLARHSEMITHVPEDASNIIPDKIYMVEKLSDYAVYENRFLYMLLCYLRDFIDARLKKLLDAGNAYKAVTNVSRNYTTALGNISYESSYIEESKKDPYSIFDKDSIPLIHRIESAQHIVGSLLQKPLMELVSKAPMLSPPITKTNVLKMNVKFRKATELYEYISSYQGEGFTIEEVKKTFSPFTDEIADDLAEMLGLTSFLAYQYGNGLKEKLALEYEAEEKLREEQELIAQQKKLNAIKERFSAGSVGVDEYVLALEQYVDKLEKQNAAIPSLEEKLSAQMEKNEQLKAEKAELRLMIDGLEQTVAQKNAEIAENSIRHAQELREADDRRLNELSETRAHYETRISELSDQYQSELTETKQAAEQAEAELTERYEGELAQAKQAAEQAEAELNDKLAAVEKDKNVVKAQLDGLRRQHGMTTDTDDYTSKERFEELEGEFLAFFELFDKSWTETRKKIRADLLWKIERTAKKLK